ncbi:MAG: trigger factor [Rubrobacteraceae bacterium]|nr:trigger factor [Rubrobacteraceae bacterium]MBA3614622.1 trigger factor [Rubrobacteraceae bacterium]MDQ3438238.1 trigger factor [Actinomycetota bacterium]
MTANVTKLEENKVRLDIEVTPESVRQGVEAKIKELGRQVRVPGFRPGKAPRRVIENRLGRDYIYMEALQEQLPGWYSQAVVETDVRPIDQPEIHFDDPLDEEEGFKFSATVEVRPEATLGDYKGVEVPRREVEITDEDVEDRIEELRAQFATLAAVEGRSAQEGDFVILDFTGERLAGGPLEGAEAEDYMLEVGAGELLPDFEDNIVGMNANERKQFGVTFPMDYAEESFRGQSVLFNVHAKEIKERDVPPLDDEFVKEASEFETLDELRVAVREQLEATAEQSVDGEFRGRVLDVVSEGGAVEVPEVMVHEKAHEMVESFERSIRLQGMDPEQYYQLAGTDHAAFEERVAPDAEDTVRKELVLDAVATAEGIVADEDEVMHEISHLAEDSERSPEEIAQTLRDNGTYAMLEEEISRQKALDFLVENAVPVPMPEEEMEEVEEPADEEVPVEARAGATEPEEREEQQ